MSNDDHDRLIRVAANWYGLYNELFVKAQRSLVDAYGAFVDAHGPLTDFATNAEMVDFEIACERAGVVLGGGNDG